MLAITTHVFEDYCSQVFQSCQSDNVRTECTRPSYQLTLSDRTRAQHAPAVSDQERAKALIHFPVSLLGIDPPVILS